jgi:hypothetical protein
VGKWRGGLVDDGGMDIQTASAIGQARVKDNVNVRVARIALDQEKAQGEAAVQLLETARDVQRATGGGGGGAGSGGVDRYA